MFLVKRSDDHLLTLALALGNSRTSQFEKLGPPILNLSEIPGPSWEPLKTGLSGSLSFSVFTS